MLMLMLMSLTSMMKVPSPQCWRRYIGVDDEGTFSRLIGEFIIDVDDKGTFSRMLEKVH